MSSINPSFLSFKGDLKTCKHFQLATKERIVWIHALHRVCLDNSLFIPTFPINDMSNSELEQAALAPHRWISLCSTFAKQHRNDSDAVLQPSTKRIIRTPHSSDTGIFLVPGGRYLVSRSRGDICVWDLGYTSNADPKLLASLGSNDGTHSFGINTTSDCMGLIIVMFK